MFFSLKQALTYTYRKKEDVYFTIKIMQKCKEQG